MPDPISMMIGSTAISAGASIFGANKQAEGQDKALAAQTAAQEKELALKTRIFEENKAGAMPWIEAGKSALESLTTKIADGSFDLRKYGMDDLIQDPGYQFRVEQGSKALDRTAAARGKLISGNQLQAAVNYGQEAGSQEFTNAFARTSMERDKEYGRLWDQSAQGLSATNALSGVATNFANSAGGTIAAGGQAAADAAVNTGNVWAGLGTNLAKTGNNAIENYMLYNRLAA